jgi:hypothetical protein
MGIWFRLYFIDLTLRFSYGLVIMGSGYVFGTLEILWVFQQYGSWVIQVLIRVLNDEWVAMCYVSVIHCGLSLGVRWKPIVHAATMSILHTGKLLHFKYFIKWNDMCFLTGPTICWFGCFK